QGYGLGLIEQSCLPPLGKGCRHAKRAPETLPVGETGVARARADRPEGERPAGTSLVSIADIAPVAGAAGRGDRPIRRRSRFTLARARAEPLDLQRHAIAVRPAESAVRVMSLRRLRPTRSAEMTTAASPARPACYARIILTAAGAQLPRQHFLVA